MDDLNSNNANVMLVDGADLPDARKLFKEIFAFGNRVQQEEPEAKSRIHHDNDFYDMKHKNRGLCIIFNNKIFDPITELRARNGTDKDAERLQDRFRELDFKVERCDNLTINQTLDKLKMVSKLNFSEDDCFVCCILSHGEEGIVYARNGKINLDQFLSPFRGDVCPTLTGKPKLFFIQACQGDKLDHGTPIQHLRTEKVETDSRDTETFKIPTHADFLIAYSTVPGFYSWRNTTNGSWFIQGLCIVLERYGQHIDLLSMMTLVNRFVAYGFESCTPDDQSMHKKKQVPHVTFTLTRKVFFTQKMLI